MNRIVVPDKRLRSELFVEVGSLLLLEAVHRTNCFVEFPVNFSQFSLENGFPRPVKGVNQVEPTPDLEAGSSGAVRTRRRGGIGCYLSGFPGAGALGTGASRGRMPRSNRATGSAYRLVKMIDAHTSLVVSEGTRLRGRIGASLSGFSGPRGDRHRSGQWRGTPEPPENVSPRSNLATSPRSGAAPRLGWLRDRSKLRSPFGKGCCPSHRRGGLVDGRKARACEKLHNHLLL